MVMDKLPDLVVLHILSRLDDTAEAARCRLVSKAFNNLYPGLPSINLQHSGSRAPSSQPLTEIFIDLFSVLEAVESVCVNDPHFMEGDFAEQWLSRVSRSLKSLSLSDHIIMGISDILPLISVYCRTLVRLKLSNALLSMHGMNPMPTLTSLTLDNIRLEGDQHLNQLNKCFPNLQVLNLFGVLGLKDPKIHLFNLKTCVWKIHDSIGSLTLITPNLITLTVECMISRASVHAEAPMLAFFRCNNPAAVHIEAPMLSRFILINATTTTGTLTFKNIDNLKTLWLDSSNIGSILSVFPITRTLENLTLDTNKNTQRDVTNSKVTLHKVFTIFPNVRSLVIKSSVWSEIEACSNPQGWDILDGRHGLKTLCVYLLLPNLKLTLSSIARVLDQCVGLSEVSLLFLRDDVGIITKFFMSTCVARWPELKWRWGIWSKHMKDSWITDCISN